MIKKPLLATLLTIVLAGCGAGKQEPEAMSVSPRPYVPTSLYSEFKREEGGSAQYGPFLAAMQAQHDEKHRLSANFFLEALEADPGSKFVADRAFFQLLYGGDVEQAAELAEALIAKDGDSDADLVLLLYALKAFKAGDYEAALERFQNQTGGFSFLITPIGSAWSHSALGDYDAAYAALAPLRGDKRLKSIADQHNAYILDYMDRFDEAEAAYQVLTAEAGSALQPVVSYSYMLYRHGKNKQAREYLSKQINRFGGNTYLLREGARIAQGKAPVQVAATPIGAAGMVFYRLASEFAQSKTTQPAVLYGRIASYLMPSSADVYYLLGTVLEEGRNPEAAAAAYNRVPMDSGLRGLADIRRIEVLRRNGKIDAAESLIKVFLRKRPNDSSMLIALGDIAQQREDYSESISYYDRALDVIGEPRATDWYIYFARAVSNERMGDWGKAERDLKKALAISPDQPGVLNYLGYTWIDRGENIAEAKGMIEKAAAARPDDGFITDSLGWVHYLTGDFQLAVTVLEKAVRLEPDDVTINDHLGDAYWRVGRKIEARFQWRHAIDSGAEGDELAKIKDKIEYGLPA
jgi:tetratricopeptide (TPR) repeat protein